VRGDQDAVRAIGEGAREFHASGGVKPVTLWIQAVTEAGQDEAIAAFLRRQLREVHDYIADVVRLGQAEGDVPGDRDADAEAWLFVGAAFLLSFADRLGDFSRRTTSPPSPTSATAGSRAPRTCEKRIAPGCGSGGDS